MNSPQGAVWALGQMSGTSLDGIDLAIIKGDGARLAACGAGLTLPYTPAMRTALLAATRLAQRLPDAVLAARTHWPQPLLDADAQVTRANAEAVRTLLREARVSPDVLGFHGQTLVHRPESALTVQLGDGAALARETGLDVVWDFRSADLRAGGQGAPLAPFFHHSLAGAFGPGNCYAVLNLGGVANLTIVDARIGAPEAPGALAACDTGPGCGLLDDWMRRCTGQPFDRGGTLAVQGRCDPEALAALMAHAYFSRPPPKSLDRNAFSLAPVDGLSAADGAATLAGFTIESVVQAINQTAQRAEKLWVTGGGRHNHTIMQGLARRLPMPVAPVEEAGLDGDLLEAQAFAHLAIRSRAALPITAPATTGCAAASTGGVHTCSAELRD